MEVRVWARVLWHCVHTAHLAACHSTPCCHLHRGYWAAWACLACHPHAACLSGRGCVHWRQCIGVCACRAALALHTCHSTLPHIPAPRATIVLQGHGRGCGRVGVGVRCVGRQVGMSCPCVGASGACPCGLMRTQWHWPPCKKKSQQKEKKPHLL